MDYGHRSSYGNGQEITRDVRVVVSIGKLSGERDGVYKYCMNCLQAEMLECTKSTAKVNRL